MKEIKVDTWEDCVGAINKVRADYEYYDPKFETNPDYRHHVRILYRGQSDATWRLSTTLERQSSEGYDVAKYLLYATRCVTELESYTARTWNTKPYPEIMEEIKKEQDSFRVHLPYYEYLIYLRHHGFPSPLLDWSESPFIAAHFAFSQSLQVENHAIFVYIERPRGVKGGMGGEPMISLFGPYVRTHERHFAQRAWYTISTEWSYQSQSHSFVPHEKVFSHQSNSQDLLYKIIVSKKARKAALRALYDFNINEFTLFQTEEALVKALAVKAFEIENI